MSVYVHQSCTWLRASFFTLAPSDKCFNNADCDHCPPVCPAAIDVACLELSRSGYATRQWFLGHDIYQNCGGVEIWFKQQLGEESGGG